MRDCLMDQVSSPKLMVPGLKLTTSGIGLSNSVFFQSDAGNISVLNDMVPFSGILRSIIQSMRVSMRLLAPLMRPVSAMSPLLVGNWVFTYM